jgi:ABC-type glycerol-3-phosphate transport system permease component
LRKKNKANGKRFANQIVFDIIVFFCVIVVIYPFIVMISGSFKIDLEMNQAPLRIFPEKGIIDNYTTLFTTIPFLRQFSNSFIVSAAFAVLSIISSAAVGYGFTRFTQFKGKKFLFSTILATMLIPSQVYMAPLFQLYRALGFFGTYLPMIIPALTNAFGIFLVRQVMSQIPLELYESATIDGYGEFFIFTRISIPLSASGLGILGVLNFMNCWNDFMTPLIYLNKEIMLYIAYWTYALAKFLQNFVRRAPGRSFYFLCTGYYYFISSRTKTLYPGPYGRRAKRIMIKLGGSHDIIGQTAFPGRTQADC